MCVHCRALQPARETIAAGTTIDRGDARIVVDARIGEGGMGVVWRAWRFRPPGHPDAGKPELIALKVLRERAMARAETRVLFLREAEVLRRLSHPNIVRYGDLFEHDSRLVLATEYVDGDTLEAIVARHLPQDRGAACLTFARAWCYFQQLLGALAAIHALDIVHRDVKPSNVIVRRDGIVKLTDFGIAHISRFAGDPPAGEQDALAPGTGAYMSPEQVLSQPTDARSDLYSAAIVLYQMCCGHTPFAADRPEFLVRKDQVDAAPPPIRAWLPQAPPRLETLFARALAKDKNARFASAIEMGDAFRAALGLPEQPEWRAQADIARAARTLLEAGKPQAERIATLREIVIRGYKTMKLASP